MDPIDGTTNFAAGQPFRSLTEGLGFRGSNRGYKGGVYGDILRTIKRTKTRNMKWTLLFGFQGYGFILQSYSGESKEWKRKLNGHGTPTGSM